MHGNVKMTTLQNDFKIYGTKNFKIYAILTYSNKKIHAFWLHLLNQLQYNSRICEKC